MEELDLKELLQVFWAKKFQIVIIISLAIIAGCIYTLNYVTPMYKSSTTLILGRINSSEDTTQTIVSENKQITQSEISINASLVSTYSELIKSESLIKEVKNNLNTNISESELRRSISVKRVSDTELIQITVTNINPGIASEVANEIAKVFGRKVEEIYKISNIYIIDRAIPAGTPYNINHVKDIMLFVICGIVISIVYIVIYNLLDTTVKSRNDIEKVIGLKHLISIPFIKNDKSELITYEDSKSVVSEAFRTLRTNVQFSSINDKKTKTYLITSCFQSEGKSYVSSNLAVTFAQAGKKVILIDSDMRRGRQSKIFNFPNEMGLSNYISNIDSDGMEINYDITRYIKETSIKNLNIITSGNVPPNPSELLASSKVPELIKELKEYYDVIIFDGAPILPITDSLILTRLLDSTILVARYNKTRKDDLAKVKSDIENVGGKIIGTCFNGVITNSSSGDLNYYYYGDKEDNSVKETIKQNLINIKQAIKKLKKLPKINKKSSKKIRIIEEVQKPVVKEAKRDESDIVDIVIKEVADIHKVKDGEEIPQNKSFNELIEEELKKQEEERIREEQRIQELKKQEEERIREEQRIQELKRQEEERIREEQRIQELKRQEEERIREEQRIQELKRQEKERIREEQRIQELKRQEEERIREEQRIQELKRQEEERIREEQRIQEEKKQEEERIREEQRIQEEKRQEEERIKEEQRIQKEALKEEKRNKKLERKQKFKESIDSFKSKTIDIKVKFEKNKEEKKIKKAEKKIKAMEEQAKHVKEKLKKAEEERNKMFGKKIMFEIDSDDSEDRTTIDKK